MTALTDVDHENQLLINFLNGDELARDDFPEQMMPRILKVARAAARDLPEDIQEEIAQQTFQNLLFMPPTTFDPERGTARQFLIGQIWNAEKQIRAAYDLPQRRKKSSMCSSQLPRIISIENPETLNLPAPSLEKSFEDKLLVETVLREAPKPLRTALTLISHQDFSKERAAQFVGISRFQLNRRIMKLRSKLMAA